MGAKGHCVDYEAESTVTARQWRKITIDARTRYFPDPTYIALLFKASGLKRITLARKLGVTPLSIWHWMTPKDDDPSTPLHRIPYSAQIVLEILANQGADLPGIHANQTSPLRSALRYELAAMRRKAKR